MLIWRRGKAAGKARSGPRLTLDQVDAVRRELTTEQRALMRDLHEAPELIGEVVLALLPRMEREDLSQRGVLLVDEAGNARLTTLGREVVTATVVAERNDTAARAATTGAQSWSGGLVRQAASVRRESTVPMVFTDAPSPDVSASEDGLASNADMAQAGPTYPDDARSVTLEDAASPEAPMPWDAAQTAIPLIRAADVERVKQGLAALRQSAPRNLPDVENLLAVHASSARNWTPIRDSLSDLRIVNERLAMPSADSSDSGDWVSRAMLGLEAFQRAATLLPPVLASAEFEGSTASAAKESFEVAFRAFGLNASTASPTAPLPHESPGEGSLLDSTLRGPLSLDVGQPAGVDSSTGLSAIPGAEPLEPVPSQQGLAALSRLTSELVGKVDLYSAALETSEAKTSLASGIADLKIAADLLLPLERGQFAPASVKNMDIHGVVEGLGALHRVSQRLQTQDFEQQVTPQQDSEVADLRTAYERLRAISSVLTALDFPSSTRHYEHSSTPRLHRQIEGPQL